MKRLLLGIIFLCSMYVNAQEMVVHLKNGNNITYLTDNIDSVTFKVPNELKDSTFNDDPEDSIFNDDNLFLGSFSVSATRRVQFAKTNLYWNGSEYKFEENQTDYPTEWNEKHVGHFFWTTLKDYKSGTAEYMPYAAEYSSSDRSTNDEFWCDDYHTLTVDGTSSLYVLSSSQWYYLLESRPNAQSLYTDGVTVGNVDKCMIIAPDDFNGTLKSSYTLEEVNALGLVCLPPAGYRDGKTLFIGNGYYWSSTDNRSILYAAQILYFGYGFFIPGNDYKYRYYGAALRLVHDI